MPVIIGPLDPCGFFPTESGLRISRWKIDFFNKNKPHQLNGTPTINHGVKYFQIFRHSRFDFSPLSVSLLRTKELLLKEIKAKADLI
ncbi:Methenyltetrahydromethanopterin cyclohydrolase [Trichinella spiralis]|uniref:Methenyltetrahydromethanopterin cyclohydrolase n=1 Tax=Trichinella spiralis TaxID=6334 RepID=A0ABR3K857_TRISP